MKILLIDPPFYRLIGYYNRYFPISLACLAAVLQKEGHKVLIYDADCNIHPSKMEFSYLEDSYPLYLKLLKDNNHTVWEETRKTIHNFNPDLVGITAWTTFVASAFKIASICKDENKLVVMGGPHISLKWDEVMKICPDVDFLVKGEGEETFLKLVKSIEDRGISEEKDELFKNIKGISYRWNGKIIHNPPREFIKNLDSLPFPARDLLLNKNLYDSEDMGLIMTSRGCPYNCAFCATSIWKRKVRYRSIDNVIREIKLVIDTYGTRQFTFKDDSFTVNRKRVLEFCDRLIEENIRINWECNTRVDHIDEELLRKMKVAGCNGIKVGIETGSERVLKLLNKRTILSQCREAAKLFKKVGIYWTGYFMMCIPSETKEEVYQTLNFMKELKPDFASFSVYEPYPGTALFKIGIERGLIQNERTLKDYYNILPKYYYVKDILRRIDTMDNEELNELEFEMKKAFHKYNMSFLKLMKRAISRSKLYIHEPKILREDLKKFWSWK